LIGNKSRLVGSDLAACGLGYLLTSVTSFLLNLFPRRILAIGFTVGLVEVLLATLVGAWLCRWELNVTR
jgi:hypothetical protein